MTDYKKLYEEALEKAKIWQQHLYESGDKDYADELNYIFPELKESEDEKIINAIKHGLKCLGWEHVDGIRIVNLIAWLEKQGEQIPANFEKTCKDEQKSAWSEECEHKKASCNDYKKIIEHYGVRKQLKKLSEEVYELQEAVIDLQDFTTCGNADTQRNQNVVEELADVFILLFQLQEFYGISKYEISDMVVYKVERTLERIKNEVENV